MPEQKVIKQVNIAEIRGLKENGSEFSDAKEFVRLGNSLTAAGLDPEIVARTAESLGLKVTRSNSTQSVLRSQTLAQRDTGTVIEMVIIIPQKQDLIEQLVQPDQAWKQFANDPNLKG